jgi:purine nucleosidase
MTGDRRPVLVDTDIGNDIDDAVCLAYLLAQPRCELLGITTVTADPIARARLASVLCRHAGRDDVPIHPGAADPLAGPGLQLPPPQAAVLDRWDHRASFPGPGAVEFLGRTIRARPGEVTLLTIGPLTNVASLFDADPEIPALLRSLVLMGGSYLIDPGTPESNLHCDPLAAARVLDAPVTDVRAVGLDVTKRVRLPADDFRRRFAAPALRPVADMAALWFGTRTDVTFNDPLAAATVFEPGLCEYARGEISVEPGDGPSAGRTGWRADGVAGRHRIAVDVRPGAVLEHYFAVVS